jgi:hypothetical protein
MATSLRSTPWPHLVVDDFLSDEILARGTHEISEIAYRFDIEPRGSGRIEYALLQSSTLWRAVYSKNLIALLREAFGVQPKLNKGNMLQLRRMNEETPAFPTHSDHVGGEESIAAFLYLSDGWDAGRGGRLCLHATEHAAGPAAYVEPLRNRLVAFRTSREHWHSVEPVFEWERLSVLSMWDIAGAD